MKTFVAILLSIAIGTLPLRVVLAQQPVPQQTPDDVIRVRTKEVKLDIVVKDKKGRLVKDLSANDFEITEDGVPQKIQSFRFVNREGADGSGETNSNARKTEPAASDAGTKRAAPGVTALVFDRLSLEARSLARRAGLSYAQEGMAAGDFTGVFRRARFSRPARSRMSGALTNWIARSTR